MAVLTVGPNSTYPTFNAAMAAAMPGDTLLLEADFPFFLGTVTKENITIFGQGTAPAVIVTAAGIHNLTLAGASSIQVTDEVGGATDNVFQGDNDGAIFTVHDGNDVVHGAASPLDFLTVDYSSAPGAVTSTVGQIVSTSTRSVTFNGIELLTLMVGDGANVISLGSASRTEVTTGAGNNVVTIDGGTAIVHVGAGDNHVTLGTGGDAEVYAGDGDNVIRTGDGIAHIQVGNGDNSITVGTLITGLITAGSGDDTIVAASGPLDLRFTGALSIQAGDGDNHVTVGDGFSYVVTGSGLDTIMTGGGFATIDSGAGADTIIAGNGGVLAHGGADADLITGGTGADVLFGDAGNDSIVGGTGDDMLTGGDGDDVLNGGDGSDTASYAGAATSGPNGTILGVTVNLTVSGLQNTGAGNDTLTNIENLSGSSFPDTLTGDANANILTGLGGADTLTGGAGSDTFVYRAATDSNAAAADTINGFQFSIDSIDLTAVAPTSVSLVRVSATDSVLFADTPGGKMQIYVKSDGLGQNLETSNFITGNNAGIVIQDTDAGATLAGSVGNDALFGNGGDDRLFGGAGADVLFGGAGSDQFIYHNQTDSTPAAPDLIADFTSGVDGIQLYGINVLGPQQLGIVQQGGNSLIFATLADGTTMQIGVLGTVQGPDVGTGRLTAGSSPNPIGVTIIGDDGFSFLLGTNQNDSLFGFGGNDVLTGGLGADVLFGGAGGDSFRFTNAAQSNAAAPDLIADFTSASDNIDLSAMAPTTVAIVYQGDNSFIFANTPGGPVQIGVLGTVRGFDIATGGVGVLIQGGPDSTLVFGSAQNDTLYGEGGNDLIVGGTGADLLFGGTGVDSFRYLSAADSNAAARDLIADFQTGIDRIDLTGTGVTAVGIASNIVFGSGPGGIAMQIGVIGAIALSDIVIDSPAPAPDNAAMYQPVYVDHGLLTL